MLARLYKVSKTLLCIIAVLGIAGLLLDRTHDLIAMYGHGDHEHTHHEQQTHKHECCMPGAVTVPVVVTFTQHEVSLGLVAAYAYAAQAKLTGRVANKSPPLAS